MNKKIFYILVPSILLAATIAVTGISAQEIDLEANNLDPNQCPTEQRRNIDNAKIDFFDYLEDQVESAELSSNRIHNIFDRYKRFQDRMANITNNTFIYGTQGAVRDKQYVAINTNRLCMIYANTALTEARTALLETYSHVLDRKKTFLLNERLDSILNRFDGIQDDLHEVRGNVNEFNDLFACYLDQCIGG